MKTTLAISKGRARQRNITVDGMRLWKRKRSKKSAPIFYVTFKRDGKRVIRSTRQIRRNVAIGFADTIRKWDGVIKWRQGEELTQPELFTACA